MSAPIRPFARFTRWISPELQLRRPMPVNGPENDEVNEWSERVADRMAYQENEDEEGDEEDEEDANDAMQDDHLFNFKHRSFIAEPARSEYYDEIYGEAALDGSEHLRALRVVDSMMESIARRGAVARVTLQQIDHPAAALERLMRDCTETISNHTDALESEARDTLTGAWLNPGHPARDSLVVEWAISERNEMCKEQGMKDENVALHVLVRERNIEIFELEHAAANHNAENATLRARVASLERQMAETSAKIKIEAGAEEGAIVEEETQFKEEEVEVEVKQEEEEVMGNQDINVEEERDLVQQNEAIVAQEDPARAGGTHPETAAAAAKSVLEPTEDTQPTGVAPALTSVPVPVPTVAPGPVPTHTPAAPTPRQSRKHSRSDEASPETDAQHGSGAFGGKVFRSPKKAKH